MADIKGNVLEIAKKIRLLAFDVDGVMTDGSVTYDENGVEYKTFNVKDGHGIVRMNKSGFITANITEIYQGQKYKLPALEEIMAKYGFTYENVCYMGDDIPDICILEKVALASCPNDAVDEVQAICNFKSSKNGGRGAVRELCDFILDAQGIFCYLVSVQLLRKTKIG